MKTLNKDLAAVQLNQVIEQLTDLADYEIIDIYNQYADMNRYEMIYDNDEDTINVLFDRAWTAISLSNHDGYKDNDDYFSYNGYGLMSSFNYLTDDNCPIDISELAEWLISEDKLSDYDIEVTTLDDMLASVEDNITDDENMLLEICKLLSLKVKSIERVMSVISDYNYKQLSILIKHLGINYQ